MARDTRPLTGVCIVFSPMSEDAVRSIYAHLKLEQSLTIRTQTICAVFRDEYHWQWEEDELRRVHFQLKNTQVKTSRLPEWLFLLNRHSPYILAKFQISWPPSDSRLRDFNRSLKVHCPKIWTNQIGRCTLSWRRRRRAMRDCGGRLEAGGGRIVLGKH